MNAELYSRLSEILTQTCIFLVIREPHQDCNIGWAWWCVFAIPEADTGLQLLNEHELHSEKPSQKKKKKF